MSKCFPFLPRFPLDFRCPTGRNPVRRMLRPLSRGKLQRSVPRVDANGLPFVEFPFQNLQAKRIENLFLDRALQRPRAINRVVALARDQLFRRVAQREVNLLRLESFR